MLATMESVVIVEKAEEIAKMILQSELADHYNRCLYNVKNNDETQRKIREFVKIKEQYEDVQRFGKYHPDYKTIMTRVRHLKREMDLDENVAELRKAENDLQDLFDEVSMLIGHSVSEHIKVPTGNPFFGSHSSGCGSGGGCSCSA
ncbi:YlbF family regulator [Bacillus sp. V3B]|uniref:YlbF family regulator n=1 Tax=Bacillus sp. V3B TaxID=2804915 RepID=UPI00210EBD85|nr:YlbF family regulator [Bacillus sp. V3B]MCQ6275146.1 YlbF family regulator [Bacillus sp. V3B]